MFCLCADSVCYAIAIYSNYSKDQDYCSAVDVADPLESLDTLVVVPSHRLECAPETVGKVHPDEAEPYKVNYQNPQRLEGLDHCLSS